jgi:hypothetical protein
MLHPYHDSSRVPLPWLLRLWTGMPVLAELADIGAMATRYFERVDDVYRPDRRELGRLVTPQGETVVPGTLKEGERFHNRPERSG